MLKHTICSLHLNIPILHLVYRYSYNIYYVKLIIEVNIKDNVCLITLLRNVYIHVVQCALYETSRRN